MKNKTPQKKIFCGIERDGGYVVSNSLLITLSPAIPPMMAGMVDAIMMWIVTSDKSTANAMMNASFETCVTKKLFITFSISTKLTLGREIV